MHPIESPREPRYTLTPAIRSAVSAATFYPVSPGILPKPILDGEFVACNLAGLRLGGRTIGAGAIYRCGARTGSRFQEARAVEWWAVLGSGPSPKRATWLVALVGRGEIPPWEEGGSRR